MAFGVDGGDGAAPRMPGQKSAREVTAVDNLRMLAFRQQNEEEIEQSSRETLVYLLERDLEWPRRRATLQGLCDMFGDVHQSRRVAVAQVLDTISWEAFRLVVGCLEQSNTPPSSSSGNGRSDEVSSDATGTLQTDKIATLSEKLCLEMAEIFRPKELHLMTLEHIHAYTNERTVRVVLAVLRRTTQRMAPVRRARFLESSLQPALIATKRVGIVAAPAPAAGSTDNALAETRQRQGSSCSDNDEHSDIAGVDYGDVEDGGGEGESPPSPLPQPTAGHVMPSRAVYEAAASAAETAMDFIGPLMEQACAERARLFVAGPATMAAEEVVNGGEDKPEATVAGTASTEEAVSASDRSLAAYLGFALSALELAAETSVGAASAAAAVTTPPALDFEDKASAVASLTRAEEQLVRLVIDNPVASLDVQFVLLHGCRMSYADRVKRRRSRKANGEEDGEFKRPRRSAGSGGSVGLGEAAVSGAFPWTLRGVSTLAYLVSCEPGLRDKLLPLVWSRRTERRLFLPHAEVDGGVCEIKSGSPMYLAKLLHIQAARCSQFPPSRGNRGLASRTLVPGGAAGSENAAGFHEKLAYALYRPCVLMRDRSKRFAIKGLELACFVAERLGGFPDSTGAFAFVWEPGHEKSDCGDAESGTWSGGDGEEQRGADASGNSPVGEETSPPSRRGPLDPHYFDVAAFLQVLVDVMVSCPLPSLRARGHAALAAFLGAAGETCRFRVLKRLVDRCPWPNVTGLLLDAFRREVDRALRRCRVEQREGETGSATAAAAASSPFASALAGDFVCEQLRRACRRGSPASLMVDMDSRTGGLQLARYAHALDAVGAGGGVEEGAEPWGTLKLREPEKLLQNKLLVQGFLDKLRGASITADNAGAEHFRLFILEDAAQQCLQELQR